MSDADLDAPPPAKEWRVTTPQGVRWQARFYTSRAAWLRVMAPRRQPGETRNAARERLIEEGWRVKLS